MITLGVLLALVTVIYYDCKECHNLECHLLTTLEAPFTIVILYSRGYTCYKTFFHVADTSGHYINLILTSMAGFT